MVTHTIDLHQIPSKNKTKSKLQILKKCQILKFCKELYTRHTFWSCLIRCINMKWIQPELYARDSCNNVSGKGVVLTGRGQNEHRKREGRTELNQYIPPNDCCARVYSSGITKMQLSVIRSICTYLMSCDAGIKVSKLLSQWMCIPNMKFKLQLQARTTRFEIGNFFPCDIEIYRMTLKN